MVAGLLERAQTLRYKYLFKKIKVIHTLLFEIHRKVSESLDTHLPSPSVSSITWYRAQVLLKPRLASCSLLSHWSEQDK